MPVSCLQVDAFPANHHTDHTHAGCDLNCRREVETILILVTDYCSPGVTVSITASNCRARLAPMNQV
jgi:hypothetical protein